MDEAPTIKGWRHYTVHLFLTINVEYLLLREFTDAAEDLLKNLGLPRALVLVLERVQRSTEGYRKLRDHLHPC